jgi:DNA-binding winged helix-turn-helix (wHTH) protein
VTFVFDEFELDPARRELRVDGKPQQLQPQVFDLLLYLVENHERVVPKQELLETLWPDTIVTESSIQRGVSLARSALGARGPALIQTFPRQGYRFGSVSATASATATASVPASVSVSASVSVPVSVSVLGLTRFGGRLGASAHGVVLVLLELDG